MARYQIMDTNNFNRPSSLATIVANRWRKSGSVLVGPPLWATPRKIAVEFGKTGELCLAEE